MFQKEAISFLLLEYGYTKNNLARLGGYPTYRDVADMSNLFYFHFLFIWSRGKRAYRDLTFRSEMGWTKIDMNTSAGLARRILYKRICTNLN